MSLLLAAALVAGAAAPCGPATAETVAADATTRVYVGREGAYRVCTRDVSGSRSVYRPPCPPSQGCRATAVRVDVAAATVVVTEVADDGTDAEVLTFDAATGLEAAPPYDDVADPAGAEQETRRVGKVVVARGGATAFSITHAPKADAQAGTRPAGTEVRRSPGCGAVRLDDGPGVDPGSVRLRRGGWIEWRRDGRTLRARVCRSARVARRVCPAARTRDVRAVGRRVVLLATVDRDTGDGGLRACAGTGRGAPFALGASRFPDDYAVGRDGAAALAHDDCKYGQCAAFVYSVDLRRGRACQLTYDPDETRIDAGSLRVDGRTVRWTVAGRPGSTPLGDFPRGPSIGGTSCGPT